MAKKAEIDEVGGVVPMDTSGVGCGAMILIVFGASGLIAGICMLIRYAIT